MDERKAFTVTARPPQDAQENRAHSHRQLVHQSISFRRSPRSRNDKFLTNLGLRRNPNVQPNRITKSSTFHLDQIHETPARTRLFRLLLSDRLLHPLFLRPGLLQKLRNPLFDLTRHLQFPYLLCTLDLDHSSSQPSQRRRMNLSLPSKR